jgi:hypothetical protein
MAQSPYSPLMLIAVNGLLQNQGLAVNAGLLAAFSQYNSIDIVSRYRTLLINSIEGGILGNNITAMQSLGQSSLPSVTNAVTNAYVSNFGQLAGNDSRGLTGQVLDQANIIMGNGNLGKFVQIYNAAQSYLLQVNQIVDSVINSDVLAETFVDMDVLITSSISDVSSDSEALSRDLQNLGQAWNLNDLDWLGFPSTLIRQMSKTAGMLPDLIGLFESAGITTNQLSALIRNNGPVELKTELAVYQVMQRVTGSLLEQVKFLLDVTTANLTSMADLLNPVKLLPNSHQLMTLRISQSSVDNAGNTSLVPIYLSNSSINSNLTNQFSRDNRFKDLSKVIPGDQALGNRAIARGLQQIKNIFVPELPDFSEAVATIENSQDLLAIAALQRPIPLSVRNSLLGMLATGTGPNGKVTLFDMIGVAAGVPYRELYQALINDTLSLQATGALNTLILNSGNPDINNGVFTVMQYTLDGEYTVVEEIPAEDPEDEPTIIFFVVIPTGLPGAGTYGGTENPLFALNSAFAAGLIPAAESTLSSIAASQPALSQRIKETVDAVVSALINEKQNFALTELDLDELSEENRSGLISLASNLHEIGTDTDPTGPAVYFEAIADRSNLPGQAIEAAMREGRNIETLNNVGIDLDTQIPLSTDT